MKRRLFILLTVVSSLLLVATAALWIDSHFKHDFGFWQRWQFNGDLARSQDDEVTLKVSGGQVELDENFLQGDTGDWDTYYLRRYGQHALVLKFGRSQYSPAVTQGDQNNVSWANRLGLDFQGRFVRGDLRLVHHKGNGVSRDWILIFPIWLPVLLFSILPVTAVCRVPKYLRVRRRKHAGLCVNCGYDVRATPDRCPECGAVSTAPPAVPTVRSDSPPGP